MSSERETELAALIYADLMASGADTATALREAAVASLTSLMSPSSVDVVAVERDSREITVAVRGPKLPGRK